MAEIVLDKLRPEVAKRVKPFIEEVLAGYGENIHSIYITGSAVTPDFDPGASDINSVFVLKEMDLKFLEVLAPKGKKYQKQRIAAPLLMTPAYIRKSLDAFPIEFLNFKLIHETVYGEDILSGIEIRHADLRLQCERELKAKLVGLRQGYLASMGDPRTIADGLVRAITGQMPLFRGVIMLFGKTPPVAWDDVLGKLAELAAVDCGAFRKALDEKRRRVKLSLAELNTIFEDYYAATEKLGKVVDELKA